MGEISTGVEIETKICHDVPYFGRSCVYGFFFRGSNSGSDWAFLFAAGFSLFALLLFGCACLRGACLLLDPRFLGAFFLLVPLFLVIGFGFGLLSDELSHTKAESSSVSSSSAPFWSMGVMVCCSHTLCRCRRGRRSGVLLYALAFPANSCKTTRATM